MTRVESIQRTETFIGDAMLYASLGWRVLPVHEDQKKPLIVRWPKAATSNPAKIEAWWRKWPNANVGLATGHGLVVLDADDHTDEHLGSKSLAELVKLHGELPGTPTATTPSGGLHLYFAGDAPTRIGFMPGLDLKGRGGFVVAPPSRFASGDPYAWRPGISPDNLAPLPQWLGAMRRARSSRKAQVAPGRAPVTEGPIYEGHRHDSLLHRAVYLRHSGADYETIAADLLTINTERCLPPLPDQEIEDIATWASDPSFQVRSSFGQHHATLQRTWAEPVSPGRAGVTDWKVMRALLKVASDTQSLVVGPGTRRLASLAHVRFETTLVAIGRLIADGHLEPAGPYLRGRARPYRLLVPVRESTSNGTGSDDGRMWLARLAFRGRENALRIAQAMYGGTGYFDKLMTNEDIRHNTPKELSSALHLSGRTVTNNLSWMEQNGMAHRTSRGHWVLTGYYALMLESLEEPAQFSDLWMLLVDLAWRRGTLDSWTNGEQRMNEERARYDEWFRARHGYDRMTGEVTGAIRGIEVVGGEKGTP